MSALTGNTGKVWAPLQLSSGNISQQKTYGDGCPVVMSKPYLMQISGFCLIWKVSKQKKKGEKCSRRDRIRKGAGKAFPVGPQHNQSQPSQRSV